MGEEPEIAPEEALEHIARVMAAELTTVQLVDFFADYPPPSTQTDSKWRYVYEILRNINQPPKGKYEILSIAAKFCNPVRYIGRQEERLRVSNDLNDALMFVGAQITQEGNLAITDQPLSISFREKRDSGSAPEARDGKPKIFISHSGESPAFYRLIRFLDDLGTEPIVAEWLPFRGRVVPDHVRTTMRDCNAAVVFATKADQVRERSQPGRGALIETGILQERFGERVIYLVEEGAQLGPMADGFARESFTQDNLERAFERIVVELKAHDLI